MMKPLNNFISLLILTSCGGTFTNTQDPCFPDKGIKTAKTTISFEENSSTNDETINVIQLTEFDNEGRPIKVSNSKEGSENLRIYENGKLTLIISKRKVLPAFYTESQMKENSEFEIDTARIIEHHANGKPKKMIGANGIIWSFEYSSCENELIIAQKTNGDTIQQVFNNNLNGILTESTFTSYNPKISSVTKYYDYKFNKRGHWIIRKYEHPSGKVFIESRKLTYY